MSEVVPDERRGSMMSMSIALGQVAMGIGGGIAGLAYTEYGYFSSTILGAGSMLAMGFLVWFGIPETRPQTPRGKTAGLIDGNTPSGGSAT